MENAEALKIEVSGPGFITQGISPRPDGVEEVQPESSLAIIAANKCGHWLSASESVPSCGCAYGLTATSLAY